MDELRRRPNNVRHDVDNDGVADGFDSCPDTPEGEEVDNNGCGKETQQPEGDVVTNHHPLTTGWITQQARS